MSDKNIPCYNHGMYYVDKKDCPACTPEPLTTELKLDDALSVLEHLVGEHSQPGGILDRAFRTVRAEIERLREYEWMYKDLCK